MKKVADYSKETLVEFIEKNLWFDGDRLFRSLDQIEKWREIGAIQAKQKIIMERIESRVKRGKSCVDLFEQDQKLMDRFSILINQPVKG